MQIRGRAGEGDIDLSAKELPIGREGPLFCMRVGLVASVTNGFASTPATILGVSKLPPSTVSGLTTHSAEGVVDGIHWASVGDTRREECADGER